MGIAGKEVSVSNGIRGYKIYPQTKGRCGDATLRSIYHFWMGEEIQQKEISRLTGSSSSEGCDSQGLVNGARQLGLLAAHFDRERDINFLEGWVSKGIPPMVCYTDPIYNEDHWASVLGINNHIFLSDSASVKVRDFSPRRFYEYWTDFQEGVRYNNTLLILPKKKFNNLCCVDKRLLSKYL